MNLCKKLAKLESIRIELVCLFLAILFIPFHIIHKNLALNLFSMGSKLSIYPILFGISLYLFEIIKKRNLIIKKKYGIYILILFFIQVLSITHGLIIFPYWDEINADQFDKLTKILNFLSSKDVFIDTNFAGKVWLSARMILKLLPALLCTYGCSLWILSLFEINQEKTSNYLLKGIVGSSILCSVYSIIEYLHLFGVHWATTILYRINPLLYDVAFAHNWWPPLFGGNRVRSLFAEPSYLTIFLAVAIPFCFYYSIVIRRKSFLWKLLPSFLLIMMLTTNSKTGMGILLAEFLAFVFFLILGRKYADYKGSIKRSLKFITWFLVTICIGVSVNNFLRHRYNINYEILDITDNHIITINVKNISRIPWNKLDDYQLTAAWYNDQWEEYGRKDVSIKETLHYGESETLTLDLPQVPKDLDYPNVVIELKKTGPYEAGLLAAQGASKLVLRQLEDGTLGDLSAEKAKENSMFALTSTKVGSNQQRYGMMLVDLKIGMKHPLLGVGGNELKQAYIVPNIPEGLKKNREIQLWTRLQKERGILRSGFPVISEYPNQFATYGGLGLFLFLFPSFYSLYELWKSRAKWLNKDNKLFLPTSVLCVAFFGLMVSYIGGNSMQIYTYWILLGVIIGWCEVLNKA